ncbi:hypothetical protein EON63_24720, partial [archaeon]
VWGLLEGMKRGGITPNPYTYSAAIHAVRHSGEEVMRIWDRMVIEGVEKNAYTYSTTISALARAGGVYVNKSLDVYKEMCMLGPSPNQYTYNSVVRAFAETGNVHQAMRVVDMMVERNVLPSQHTYTMLLLACGRGNVSERGACDGMVTTSSPSPYTSLNSSSPSPLSYIPYILEQMHIHNIPVDMIVYATILDVYRRHHHASNCVHVLYEMMDRGIRPACSHVNIVFKALKDEVCVCLYNIFLTMLTLPFHPLSISTFTQGKAEQLYKLYTTLSPQPDITLNGNTYELVVEALLTLPNRHKDILSVIKHMDTEGYNLSLANCVWFIQVLERTHQYNLALAMYKYLVVKKYDFYDNPMLNEVFKALISGLLPLFE